MKNKEWAAYKTKEIVDELLNFFGPEHEYKMYMANLVGRALLEAINSKRPDELKLEKAFEDSVNAYKLKNPDHKLRDVVIYELAFFEAVKYTIKYEE